MKLRPLTSLVCLALLSTPVIPAVADDFVTPSPADSTAAPAQVSVSAFTAGETGVYSRANVWGTASGAPDSRVWTEVKLANGSWSRSQIGTTSETGFYAIPLTYGSNQAGRQDFRVGVATPQGTVYSQPVSLNRVAKVSISSADSAPVGRVANAWGTVTGVPRAKVWTEVRLSNGKWSRSQTGTADAKGYYVLPLTYGSNAVGSYTFRVGASTPTGTVYSGTTTIKRTGSVSAYSATTKNTGVESNAWGTVAGARNARVWTEVKLPNGQWSRSATGTTDSRGGYILPLTYGADTAGTYTFRVAASVNGGTIYSSPFTFQRTAAVDTRGFVPDGRCMYGRVFCASQSQRKMAWMVDGQIIEVIDVRFGLPSTPTRNGNYSIFWKDKDHISSLFNVPMPFSQFFSGGQAIHYSADFARVGYNGGSAGCINVGSWAEAERMWNYSRTGDRVVTFN